MTSERRISDLPRILILLLSPGDFFSNISDIFSSTFSTNFVPIKRHVYFFKEFLTSVKDCEFCGTLIDMGLCCARCEIRYN